MDAAKTPRSMDEIGQHLIRQTLHDLPLLFKAFFCNTSEELSAKYYSCFFFFSFFFWGGVLQPSSELKPLVIEA